MIVYHGSNCEIGEIDILKGSRYKDFGQGFYVTPDRATAERMARKKTKFFKGNPIVTEFEFDESVLSSSELRTLVFPEKATTDWILFVAKNRNKHNSFTPGEYDIVKGPIADDGVALQLRRIMTHADQAELIALDLQDKYLDQQIYFGTQKALTYLKKKSVCQLN